MPKQKKNVEMELIHSFFMLDVLYLVAFSTSCHRKSNISKKFEFKGLFCYLTLQDHLHDLRGGGALT